MFKFISKLFKKKEELKYPSDFALITYNESAKENGILNDRMKIIKRYKDGKLISVENYSEEKVKLLREVKNIPVEEEQINDDFEFEEIQMGGITR